MLWSLQEASQRGFAVDQQKLDQWTDWSLTQSLAVGDDGIIAGSKNLDGLEQLLLAHGDSPISDTMAENYEAIKKIILDGQQPDGAWKPRGQLPDQRRPAAETMQVSTMWAILALAYPSQTEETANAIQQARTWLQDAKPGLSSEWLIVRLLVENRFGDPNQTKKYLEQLLQLQNEDGGWSWLTTEPSDPFATGQALYALAILSTKNNNRAIQRAQQFLLNSQQKDGSWLFPSTLTRKKGETVATSIYWGTAWATIGLVRTLPD